MAHNDESFWISIFRQAPIVAAVMAVCGIIGGVAGAIWFVKLWNFLRVYLCAIISCAAAGVFIGLILGVALDTMFGSLFRRDKKKKRTRSIWKD